MQTVEGFCHGGPHTGVGGRPNRPFYSPMMDAVCSAPGCAVHTDWRRAGYLPCGVRGSEVVTTWRRAASMFREWEAVNFPDEGTNSPGLRLSSPSGHVITIRPVDHASLTGHSPRRRPRHSPLLVSLFWKLSKSTGKMKARPVEPK